MARLADRLQSTGILFDWNTPMSESGTIGRSPVARAYLDEGPSPLFPDRLHPLPWPGQRGIDAHGHEIITTFFKLKAVKIDFDLQLEVYRRIGAWLRRFDVFEVEGSGDSESQRFTERALGPIRHFHRSYKWRKVVGTIAVTLIKDGQGGAAVLVSLTESPYNRPMPSRSERARYPKDWRKVFGYPWKYTRFM